MGASKLHSKSDSGIPTVSVVPRKQVLQTGLSFMQCVYECVCVL